jgi:Uri superfamily endonuclease
MAIDPDIQVLGSGTNGGCYLMEIQLNGDQNLRFGMFKQGQEICLKSGIYLYIGSALAEQGPSSLGARILRHATRSEDAPPHAIRERLHHALLDAGLPGKVPAKKTCRWHIDYLLDLPQADLCGVIALRSLLADEASLANALAEMPETIIPARGLGASDHPAGTHLFRVQASAEWWDRLPQLIQDQLQSDDGNPKI